MGQSLLPPSGGDDHILPVDLKAALEERYLAYALSTIMHRALPDVRDGLEAGPPPHYPRNERNGAALQFLVQEMRPYRR